MTTQQNLLKKIGNSAYLSRLQAMSINADLQRDKALTIDYQSSLESLIDEVKSHAVIDISAQDTQDFLVAAKCRFAYLWSLAQLFNSQLGSQLSYQLSSQLSSQAFGEERKEDKELNKELYKKQGEKSNKPLSFDLLGMYQSQFADATIDCALRAAWYSDDLKRVRKQLPNEEGGVPGLFVLGLGKLGGWDLNFSSDVDLIAYYCDKTLPVSTTIGQGYIVNKVLQKMTGILTNNNQVDFVWRVDWRLRPEASSSLLTMSTKAASEFYFYRALPWHRLAMMKARVVAGDALIGAEFLSELQSFVWRQNLDLSAIDELAHIKKRINLEHPGLKHQRAQPDAIEPECAGFNVKLGSGGIREIEFIVNALQLLWGGKKLRLRETNTLKALEVLSTTELLGESDVAELRESYHFLRDLENHIQMLNNAQTHSVPTEAMLQEQLIAMRSYEGVVSDDSYDDSSDDSNDTDKNGENFSSEWQHLCEQILKHRLRVNELFETFFKAEVDAQAEPFELPEAWDEQLNNRSKAIIENWTTGFTNYGVPSSMAVSLEPLSQQLLSAVFKQGLLTEVDNWLASIDDFLASQSNASQYFRLLASYPDLVESIVPPLQYSPHMAKLLKQSPHIIDNLTSPQKRSNQKNSLAQSNSSQNSSLQSKQTILSLLQSYEHQVESVFASKDYGVRLESLRRYVNENLYEAYLGFMQSSLSVAEFQQSLTCLAQCTLDASLKIAQQELCLDKLPIAVLGMGKLAMSRMSPLSDLDLVFIFADDFELDVAQKVVARLQTILGMELKEGIAYELDTRLRPSGRSGPPTVFLSGFRDHHLQRAKSWEHIALLPSRIVAGDLQLGEQVIQIKHEVFHRKRDASQWLIDAKKMWQRVESQRIQKNDGGVASSKLRQGGLMQSEYLAVCMCVEQLADAGFYANNRDNIDNFSELLKSVQAVKPIQVDLHAAIEFWSTVQIWERLLGLENASYDDMPSHFQTLMCEQLGCDSLESFYHKADEISQNVEKAMQAYFSNCSLSEQDLEEWQETQIQWV